mmetsp:Transcript_86967/g.281642  ORF Transcript_86967/g.281642 Transcript_86967/m.281642 type:complete len:452 (-) Transcript_86967:56-1411(-)
MPFSLYGWNCSGLGPWRPRHGRFLGLSPWPPAVEQRYQDQGRCLGGLYALLCAVAALMTLGEMAQGWAEMPGAQAALHLAFGATAACGVGLGLTLLHARQQTAHRHGVYHILCISTLASLLRSAMCGAVWLCVLQDLMSYSFAIAMQVIHFRQVSAAAMLLRAAAALPTLAHICAQSGAGPIASAGRLAARADWGGVMAVFQAVGAVAVASFWLARNASAGPFSSAVQPADPERPQEPRGGGGDTAVGAWPVCPSGDPAPAWLAAVPGQGKAPHSVLPQAAAGDAGCLDGGTAGASEAAQDSPESACAACLLEARGMAHAEHTASCSTGSGLASMPERAENTSEAGPDGEAAYSELCVGRADEDAAHGYGGLEDGMSFVDELLEGGSEAVQGDDVLMRGFLADEGSMLGDVVEDDISLGDAMLEDVAGAPEDIDTLACELFEDGTGEVSVA